MSASYVAWGLCGTLFLFCMTTFGSAAVFFFRGQVSEKVEKVTFGFAAGVMAAASIWSLLLPAMERTEGLPRWCPAAVGVVAGTAFLMGLDGRLSCRQWGTMQGRDALLFCAITLHNIPEGMAVGLAFAMAQGERELWAAAALALGIGIQNFPEGAAISLPLYQSGASRRRAFLTGTASGLVEPIFGMAVMLAADSAAAIMPWLLGFAAGAMLYVTVSELVPESASRTGTVGFMTGFLLMMILDVALG